MSGLIHARHRKFDLALQDFEHVLAEQPESFAARLLQSVCFLQLHRHAEAKVALSSCIAQRPHFLWSYFYRSQASVALGDQQAARVDLQRVLDQRPSDALRRAAVAQWQAVARNGETMSAQQLESVNER